MKYKKEKIILDKLKRKKQNAKLFFSYGNYWLGLEFAIWRGEFNMLHSLWFAGCKLPVARRLLLSWLLPQTGRWPLAIFTVCQEKGLWKMWPRREREKLQLNCASFPWPDISQVSDSCNCGCISPAFLFDLLGCRCCFSAVWAGFRKAPLLTETIICLSSAAATEEGGVWARVEWQLPTPLMA